MGLTERCSLTPPPSADDEALALALFLAAVNVTFVDDEPRAVLAILEKRGARQPVITILDPELPVTCFVYRDGRSSQWNDFEADAVAAMVTLAANHLTDDARTC